MSAFLCLKSRASAVEYTGQIAAGGYVKFRILH